ncbi:MAG: hypothetical protein PF447_09250 [Spirochaetaceae bacterium]|jgi:hypothetical protein|nr:hypothetical protein [Spirochaetaceae bacterium]
MEFAKLNTKEEILKKVSSSHLSKFSSVFSLQSLKKKEPNTLVVKMSPASYGICLFLIFVGLLLVGLEIFSLIRPEIVRQWYHNNRFSMMALVIGVAISYGGFALWKLMNVKQYFLRDQLMYRGKKELPFDSLIAVQLVSIDNNTASELNLIQDDGDRIHLMAAGGVKKLEEAGTMLSEFLNKPLIRGNCFRPKT